MTTLNDREISKYGSSLIHPYEEANLQPASIDVRLGNDFAIFQRDKAEFVDFRNPVDITKRIRIEDDQYFTLHPREFALGVTREKLTMPDDLVARLEGKSSIGKLGLFIHVTAGFIDPGFNGVITLEMYGLHPLALRLWPGMLIAQISFQRMDYAAVHPYNGRYQNSETVEISKYIASLTHDITHAT